jgi:hypothetical protein
MDRGYTELIAKDKTRSELEYLRGVALGSRDRIPTGSNMDSSSVSGSSSLSPCMLPGSPELRQNTSHARLTCFRTRSVHANLVLYEPDPLRSGFKNRRTRTQRARSSLLPIRQICEDKSRIRFDESMIRHRIFEYSDSIE